jgi:hypothetical protein
VNIFEVTSWSNNELTYEGRIFASRNFQTALTQKYRVTPLMTTSKIRHNNFISLTIMSTETILSSNTESALAMPSPVDVVSTLEAHSMRLPSPSAPVFRPPPSLEDEVISSVRKLGHVTLREDGRSEDSRLVVGVSLFVVIFILSSPPPSSRHHPLPPLLFVGM